MAGTWPDRRLVKLFGIEVPVVQAPMAGAQGAALGGAVTEAGGLGSLPCSLLDAEAVRAELAAFRAVSSRPVNVNFFCHDDYPVDGGVEAAWRDMLGPYYNQLGLGDASPYDVSIDDARRKVVEELRPEVVSFHFGLPPDDLLDRGAGERGAGDRLGHDGARGPVADRTGLRRGDRPRR